MLQFDDNIISVIDNAYKCGYNLPEKHFKNAVDMSNEKNVFENYPLYIVKPDGVEFSYIAYYSGKSFYGSYMSINNNFTSVQRGMFSRNGETLFSSNVFEIRKCFKKSEQKGWLIKSFILGDDNKIYFWGNDNIDHYKQPISIITGMPFEELTDQLEKGERFKRPKGFVASVMIKAMGSNRFILTNDEPHDTITSAWKALYNKCDELENQYEYTYGIESYMRTAYAKLKLSDKLF